MRRWWPLLAAVVAVAAGAVWLAGRGESGPSALLTALQADPLASYTPPGAKLVSASKQDQGGSFGKGTELRVDRNFDVPVDIADRAFERTRRFAEDSGWRFDGKPIRIGEGAAADLSTVGERVVLNDRAATLTVVMSGVGAAEGDASIQITVGSGNQVVSPE